MSDELDNDKLNDEQQPTNEGHKNQLHTKEAPLKVTRLSGLYQDWFLDYASYVNLERAVPHINDGLKPVQRRILHSMKRMDDGRYNKVANIIGHTMQFHPHGDASIGDALVQLGQKELLVDCQGNWGNILTGDSAAAPRYIEARLSKFANDVVFNPKTTNWKPSYDGRNKEPITLPVKFPLLLAQGVEGIGVGLASKILPHNFIELIDASVKYLKGQDFELYPDFPTGGSIDVTRYNDGMRGGSVRVRAKIKPLDKKTLVITEIPFSTTTSSLIDSILKANDKGKIKIRKIEDNTAANVEIHVHLQPGISPDKTIDALYAFTDCDTPISPNCCVIDDNCPQFIGVTQLLKTSADNTLSLLRQELEIQLNELEDDWHYSSLEKIFFEERIYRELEKDTAKWEDILDNIDKAFNPFRKRLRREIVRDDIVKLTEKPVRKISKFDIKKADEHIKSIEDNMEEVKNDLAHIVEYTIRYFENIRKKYGTGRERKTEIRTFDSISATDVVVANEKLYVNREEGFMGTGLKKDEYVCDCSDIDDILVIRRDGKYIISKVSDKSFVGKDIIHIAVFRKNDVRTIYNAVYRDGQTGITFMKRFAITGITRDKEYDITRGTPNSKVLYFTANPNGEAELVKVYLKPRPRLKNTILELNFGDLAIKGKASQGNIVTRYPIHKVLLKEKGESTLAGIKLWFDWDILRLNTEERGQYLGEFQGGDRIIIITKSGQYRICNFDLTNHFEDDALVIEKFDNEKIYSAVYWDNDQKYYYLKRFILENTDKLLDFIGTDDGSSLLLLSGEDFPRFELTFGGKNKNRESEIIDAEEFIAVKGFKAKGKRLTTYEVDKITEIEPAERELPEDVEESEDETTDLPDENIKFIDPDQTEQMSLF
jgi:topoisomerase-4 subunit A